MAEPTASTSPYPSSDDEDSALLPTVDSDKQQAEDAAMWNVLCRCDEASS